MRSIPVLFTLLLTGTMSFAVPLEEPAMARYVGNAAVEDELLKPSQRRNSNLEARNPTTSSVSLRDYAVEDELLKTTMQQFHDSEVEDELLKTTAS